MIHPSEEQLSAYVDGVLGPDGADKFINHLLACSDCRQKVAELRVVVQAVGDLPRPSAPAHLKSSVMELVHRADGVRPLAGQPERAYETESRPHGDDRRRWVPAAMVAGFVLLLMLGGPPIYEMTAGLGGAARESFPPAASGSSSGVHSAQHDGSQATPLGAQSAPEEVSPQEFRGESPLPSDSPVLVGRWGDDGELSSPDMSGYPGSDAGDSEGEETAPGSSRDGSYAPAAGGDDESSSAIAGAPAGEDEGGSSPSSFTTVGGADGPVATEEDDDDAGFGAAAVASGSEGDGSAADPGPGKAETAGSADSGDDAEEDDAHEDDDEEENGQGPGGEGEVFPVEPDGPGAGPGPGMIRPESSSSGVVEAAGSPAIAGSGNLSVRGPASEFPGQRGSKLLDAFRKGGSDVSLPGGAPADSPLEGWASHDAPVSSPAASGEGSTDLSREIALRDQENEGIGGQAPGARTREDDSSSSTVRGAGGPGGEGAAGGGSNRRSPSETEGDLPVSDSGGARGIGEPEDDGAGGGRGIGAADVHGAAAEAAGSEPELISDSEGGGGDPDDFTAEPAGLQKIIHRGAMMLEVRDVKHAHRQVVTVAGARGGFIEESSLGGGAASGADGTAFLVIRVPREALTDVMDDIGQLGAVRFQTAMSGENITAQYVDVESRLRTMNAQEQRYLALLDKAESVAEMLQIENELWRLRSDIESMLGQLAIWDFQMQTAPLELTLEQVPSGAAAFFYPVSTTIVQAGTRLGEGFQAVVYSGAWALPWLMVMALAAWIWRRVWAG